MKRFRQRLFNGLAAISLLLFLATITLWIRGDSFPFWWGWDDVVAIDALGREAIFASSRGEFSLSFVDLSAYGSWDHRMSHDVKRQNPTTGLTVYRNIKARNNLEWAGFYTAHGSHVLHFTNGKSGPITQWDFGVPDWFIALAAGLMPMLWYVSFRHRNRTQPCGLCPNCGYDLRATPDRCPECGTVPPRKETPK